MARLSLLVTYLLLTLATTHPTSSRPFYPLARDESSEPLAPKVFIISMWTPEAQVWYDRFPSSGLGNLLSQSLSTPGLSMLYPSIFCTADASICHATLGEGEINAAASMTALVLSPKLDLRSTYFLFGGIAGVNPRHATLGSVAIARYAVQVALQYEIDARSLPDEEGWASGYFAYGSNRPLEYPSILYGTEVFELNAALRDLAYTWASSSATSTTSGNDSNNNNNGNNLSDAAAPRAYRRRYASMGEEYSAAVGEPGVVKCDTATSDVYYSGRVLAEAFENTTSVWTNGTGVYCMTAQEDNANLEVMVRAAIDGLVDFSRIIVMRAGSNFDRPPDGVSDWEHLALAEQNGFDIAIDNIYNAGITIVRGLLDGWDCTFSRGVETDNYVGDIFGSLGGYPDFGPGSLTGGARRAGGGGTVGGDRNDRVHVRRDGDGGTEDGELGVHSFKGKMKRRFGRQGC